jgi:DNA recombination protein RmuC
LEALLVIVGVCVGAGLVLLILALRRRPAQELARQLIEQTQAEKIDDLQRVIEQIRAAFATLSQEALSTSSEQFLRLAETRLSAQTKQGETALEAKKTLIDETVRQMAAKLTELAGAVQSLDKDRRESHGALVKHLETATQATTALQVTAGQLREALASPKRRGQWGERMAEDVLRLAGFVEGVNYQKQAREDSGSQPDFTFPLPQGQRVNMDVKFPLDNYLRYLDVADEPASQRYKLDFLRDVRGHVKAVTTREYIDPGNGTVDYVLVFIPNEQVYGFIHEHDASLLDDALRQKVVLCSPLTLYAILAVIRQAVESFRLEQASREILSLLGAFNKEWGKYVELMEKMGRKLDEARSHFDELTTTRTRQLDRRLDKIEELRTRERVALPVENEGEA